MEIEKWQRFISDEKWLPLLFRYLKLSGVGVHTAFPGANGI